MKKIIPLVFAALSFSAIGADVSKPGAAQLHALEQEVVAIIHFGLNTFTDKEWSFGDTPASMFDPGDTLDATQWVAAAKAGGVKRIILVCKHHDGFCLWPSKCNSTYTVANTPWKKGKGDLVREVSDAARAAGLEFAAYVSPWDRNHADYARAEYTEYFHAQWLELMNNYGPIWEVWLDGANCGTGWYGGANETRKIADYDSYYDYPRLVREIEAHNPLCSIFNLINDRSLRWPGNERGVVPEDFNLVEKGVFLPPEADTPLRTKWFYHADDHVKSLKELTDDYVASVGRSGILNLGLAPNRKGLLDDSDVARLKEFGDWVRAFNAYDAMLDEVKEFDYVDLQEDLGDGLRVKSWSVVADGREIANGGQIGFRRIVPTGRIKAREVLVKFNAKGGVAKVSLKLRKAPQMGADEGVIEGVEGNYLIIPNFNMVEIARTPVTNAEYAKFLKSTLRRAPKYWKNDEFPAGRENHPVVWVSYDDALAYCEWLEKIDTTHSYRLPTEAEWCAAAGPTPRGAQFNCNKVIAGELLKKDPSRLVEFVHPKSVRKAEKLPLNKVLGVTPDGRVTGWVNHLDYTGFIYTDLFKEINDAGGNTTPVDAYASTKTASGAIDMWGNSWEWTSTEKVATNGAERGKMVNVIKGGSWYANRKSCATEFTGEGRMPHGVYNTVGFRVVRESKSKYE